MELRFITNVATVSARFRARREKLNDELDKAVGQNAAMVVRESIVEIDQMIYSTPESPTYSRTKNLRRSNKMKKLGLMTWLVYNDADYAGPVHDGTSQVEPRPWMQNAIDNKRDDMKQNLSDAGVKVLRG